MSAMLKIKAQNLRMYGCHYVVRHSFLLNNYNIWTFLLQNLPEWSKAV